jgi:hypothetical protein
MNIKIKYAHFTDQFVMGLQKLANCPFPPKTAYNISRINSKINSELGHSKKIFMSLLEKYGERDDKKQFIFDPATRGHKIKTDSIKKYDEEYAEMLQIEVTIEKVYPVTLTQLEEMPKEYRLNAFEMTALEPILLTDEVSEPKALPAKLRTVGKEKRADA